jgi:hypothetical protein
LTLPNGYLPPGVHPATKRDIIERFGMNSPRRQVLASRLEELLSLARETSKLQRVFIWGSFVTGKSFPGDLNVFLLLQEGFDREFMHLSSVQRCVFEHERARLLFEADVLWAIASIGAEELVFWLIVHQLSRDIIPIGIVEVIFDD